MLSLSLIRSVAPPSIALLPAPKVCHVSGKAIIKSQRGKYRTKLLKALQDLGATFFVDSVDADGLDEASRLAPFLRAAFRYDDDDNATAREEAQATGTLHLSFYVPEGKGGRALSAVQDPRLALASGEVDASDVITRNVPKPKDSMMSLVRADWHAVAFPGSCDEEVSEEPLIPYRFLVSVDDPRAGPLKPTPQFDIPPESSLFISESMSM